MKNYPDDKALVSAILADGRRLSDETMGALLDRCHVSICYVCRRFGEEYDEILSVLFLHLRRGRWARLKQWGGNSSLKTWLRAVIVNLARDRARKKDADKTVAVDQLEVAADEDIDLSLIRVEQSTLLFDAIEKLASDQRYAIMRCYFGEASLREIGEELGKKENNVKQILMKARRKIRSILEEKRDE